MEVCLLTQRDCQRNEDNVHAKFIRSRENFEFLDVKNKEKPQSHSSRLNLSDFSETADGRAGGSGSRCPVTNLVSTILTRLPTAIS